jgi:hypothetical protein
MYKDDDDDDDDDNDNNNNNNDSNNNTQVTSWCRVFLEKLIVSHLVIKLPAIYGRRRHKIAVLLNTQTHCSNNKHNLKYVFNTDNRRSTKTEQPQELE